MRRRTFTILGLLAALGCEEGTHLTGDEDAADDSAARDDAPGEDATGDDAAPDVPGTCPAEWPDPGDSCTGSATCEYGSETCCGETHPSYVCSCMGGTWGCYTTDACMGAPFMCSCETDEDCEPGGFGRAWCVDGRCVPCDDSGRDCLLACEYGLVPERNGCQPCECSDEPPCELVGEGSCTCDAPCADPGMTCETGLGRCVRDFCSIADCIGPCDPLRGCLSGPECATSDDCRLIYSGCSCQAVPASDPRDRLDDCDYDGGMLCYANHCEIDGVQAACVSGLCTELWPPGCGG
ncbi:MAG: hypothetical protein JXB32_07005 [Deltaproteobacteria bacterium]|nr:hypothetical protein [Deltaproteobacteria bacterium]